MMVEDGNLWEERKEQSEHGMENAKGEKASTLLSPVLIIVMYAVSTIRTCS
jgi:hypothetical protein